LPSLGHIKLDKVLRTNFTAFLYLKGPMNLQKSHS